MEHTFCASLLIEILFNPHFNFARQIRKLRLSNTSDLIQALSLARLECRLKPMQCDWVFAYKLMFA